MDALTVCVNYTDYLNYTLPNNRQFFDSYWVICDKNTSKYIQPLCNNLSADIIETNLFYADKANFNKGSAINFVLQKLKKKSRWICHLDADIWINESISTDLLDISTIYGCPRRMCPDPANFKQFLRDHSIQKSWPLESAALNRLTEALLTTDVVKQYLSQVPEDAENYDALFPIGYFQLFYNTCQSPTYPTHIKDASMSDMLFTMKWKRVAGLETEVVHLPMIDGTRGQNWGGRVTPEFKI